MSRPDCILHLLVLEHAPSSSLPFPLVVFLLLPYILSTSSSVEGFVVVFPVYLGVHLLAFEGHFPSLVQVFVSVIYRQLPNTLPPTGHYLESSLPNDSPPLLIAFN